MENIEDIVISLLRSTPDSKDNWKSKLLHIFYDVAGEVVSDFLNITNSFEIPENSTKSRQRRSLEVADLIEMMGNLFPEEVRPSKFSIYLQKEEDVISHKIFQVLGTQIKDLVHQWMEEKMETIANYILNNKVLLNQTLAAYLPDKLN